MICCGCYLMYKRPLGLHMRTQLESKCTKKKRDIMISARGTKTVRLQRRKSGLDFSIKGGSEHGIGVVVSWIKEGGAGQY